MDNQPRRKWIRAALLVGAVYLAIGRVSASQSDNVRAWRLAAWLLSGAIFAAHIWYEHSLLRSHHRLTAFHAAVAVAIGAFGLAVAAMIHSLSTAAGFRPVWFLALLLWPAVTAVPAFLVALLIAALLTHFRAGT